MADAVTSQVLFNEGQRYVALFTSISDGTGEAAVKKVDISTLVDAQGNPVTQAKIEKVEWATSLPYIALSFDHDTDITPLVLPQSGTLDFRGTGGLYGQGGTGGTGDILLTAPAGHAGSAYMLMLTLKK